jgi:hypothetical protein
MALECMTYDRSKIYAEELGPESMKIWQPKQLMKKMLEVDPQADIDSSFSFGTEPSLGKTPSSLQLLGTDYVLNLRTLKKHYDAIGAYLHTPTLAQIEQGKGQDYKKLADRCSEIIEALELALSSKVWNSTLANRGTIDCENCGSVINRRLPTNKSERIVECWSCPASYTMTEISGNRVRFEARQLVINCPTESCEEVHYIWERDFKRGQYWNCQSCHSNFTIELGLVVSKVNTDDD